MLSTWVQNYFIDFLCEMGGNQLEKVAGVVEEDHRVRDDRQEPHTLRVCDISCILGVRVHT